MSAASNSEGRKRLAEQKAMLGDLAADFAAVTAPHTDPTAAAVRAAQAEVADLLSVAHRFWPRVEIGAESECWPWTGPTVGHGHGRFETPAGSTAHRYAWASASARLPRADEVVRHRCDNPPCCNPSHLEIGTQADNVTDMIQRGRASWPKDACRKGHARTPDNTLLRSDGSRRCKTCTNESDRERRKGVETVSCTECDYEGRIYNVVRHLARMHGIETTSPDLRDRADRLATDTAAPEGEVGTGADEGATGQDTGTAWVTRSTDCPEAPAQAHLPAAPVAVEGVETVETLAEVLTDLNAHERCYTAISGRGDEWCSGCDWTGPRHRDHLATLLAARIVQARAGEGAVRERIEALLADGPDTWTPYESRDTGWTFLQESVLDFTADLRAALDPEATT